MKPWLSKIAVLLLTSMQLYSVSRRANIIQERRPRFTSILYPMSDSETEPESDAPSSPKKACPLDPTDVSITSTLSDSIAQLVNTPQTHSSDPISAVNAAIKTLESLDFSLIRKVVSLSKSTNTNNHTQTCTGCVFTWNHSGVIGLTSRVLACRACDESNLRP